MTRVFVVQHVHELVDGSEDVKLIGVFSSELTANAAVHRVYSQPGFATARTGSTSTRTSWTASTGRLVS